MPKTELKCYAHQLPRRFYDGSHGCTRRRPCTSAQIEAIMGGSIVLGTECATESFKRTFMAAMPSSSILALMCLFMLKRQARRG